MSDQAPTTKEIVALQGLGRSVDERWVVWALDLLEAGDDTPSLRRLAGATEPFSPFEMGDLVDRALSELNLPRHADREHAALALAAIRARQLLDGVAPADEILRELAFLCIEFDYLDDLLEFHHLHFAWEDLQSWGQQYYLPDVDRGNVEEVVRQRCERWLREHDGA